MILTQLKYGIIVRCDVYCYISYLNTLSSVNIISKYKTHPSNI